MKKVLVLGGTGFLGRNLVDNLLRRNYQVTVVSRHLSTLRRENLVHLRADITTDLSFLSKLKGFYECIFHAVTATVPFTAEKKPIYDVEKNLVGFIQLLESLQSLNFGSLVYISSGGTVYGNPDDMPVTEDAPCNPINSYGIVKVAAEGYLRLFAKRFGFKHCILRVSNPFGPDQINSDKRSQGIVGILIHNIITGKSMDLYNYGNTQRDFIYIEDVSHALILAMEKLAIGTFNIGSGYAVSISEVVDKLFRVSGLKVPVNLLPKREFDVDRIVLDSSKFSVATGWAPNVDLDSGLRKTWHDIVDSPI